MNARWPKWEDRFNARLDCPAPTPPSTPKADYFWTWTGSEPIIRDDFAVGVGETVKISVVCNPDWVDNTGVPCSAYQQYGYCIIGGENADTQEQLIFYANYNSTEQTYQTSLNCPECGCTDTYINLVTDFEGPTPGQSSKKHERKLV